MAQQSGFLNAGEVLLRQAVAHRQQVIGDGVLGTGSFVSLSQNYNRYKWSKMFEQEFVALSSGFVSETAPAVLELSRNISGLSGPVEDLYAQWRVYLRELYEIETATTAP